MAIAPPLNAKQLYTLYCEGLEEAAREVRSEFKFPSSRRYLLTHCTPEPFEHFEARLATLASRGELDEYVSILRAGFAAC